MDSIYRSLAICVRARFVVLVLLALIAALAQLGKAELEEKPVSQGRADIPPAQKDRIARSIASKYGRGAFQSSLEMKEQFDFLITPALLVQEALSEECILTYPME